MVQFRAASDIEFERRKISKAPPSAPPRLLLFGRVVTMDAARTVIEDGVVGISGNEIALVADRSAPRSPDWSSAVPVETNGTIYPGLIELHNHPAYNAIPLWNVPKLYTNRKQWRADPLYYRQVSFPATLTGKNLQDLDYPRAIARFVECKALLGGHTTFAGLSSSSMKNYTGLARNVEFPAQSGWPVAVGRIDDFKNPADAENIITPFLGDASRSFLLHLSEGIDQDARDVFGYLKKADGNWLLAPNILTIHGLGLIGEDFQLLARSGGLVWSPLSNLLLYGKTADVAAAKAAGVKLALGADWAPSGSKNLLGELKIARIVSAQQGGLFSDRELVEMVTCSPAQMLGWHPWVGSIATDRRGDLLVLSRKDKDPYAQLIEATEEDVSVVLIDGRPRCGRSDVVDPQSPGSESYTVGRSTFLIDLAEAGTDPLAGMKLSDAVNKLVYGFGHLPELAQKRQQYGRGEWNSPFTLHLEFEDPQDHLDIAAEEPPISPGDVDRMAIEPITAVDDAAWTFRLKSARNVPDWLRNAL